jgi:hypothetical protein
MMPQTDDEMKPAALPGTPPTDGAVPQIAAATFDDRMREVELAWKREETDLRRRELSLREESFKNDQTRAEKDSKAHVATSLVSVLGVSVPLLVAVITAFVGFKQNADTQIRTAQINSAATVYAAELDARKAFFQKRDAAYYHAIALAGQVDGAYYSNQGFTSSSAAFQACYRTEIRPVDLPGDKADRAAHAFSEGLIYMTNPPDKASYAADINNLWAQDHPKSPPLNFQNPGNLLDILEQNMDSVLTGAILSESDPDQYPNGVAK